MKKEINTHKAPKAVGPYSQGIATESAVYLSGQIPLDPETGRLVEGDAKKQTEQVMKNIGTVLNEEGLTFDDIIKAVIYLTDLKDFDAVNEAYSSLLGKPYPARSCIEVSALPKGASVEIEVIAARHEEVV